MIYILLAVYLLSAYFYWKYLHIAHSYGGRWSNSYVTFFDLFSVVAPGFNTLFCISSWSERSPHRVPRRGTLLNKIFNIKNK